MRSCEGRRERRTEEEKEKERQGVGVKAGRSTENAVVVRRTGVDVGFPTEGLLSLPIEALAARTASILVLVLVLVVLWASAHTNRWYLPGSIMARLE